MEVCEELKILSKEFKNRGHKLYIVGGYVRDQILGLKNDDIDITSSMPCEEVIEVCNKLKIKANCINKKLGTLQLRYNNFKFEYTRFRIESYNKKGNHTPDSVEFTLDINTDALRRDFTINSIYYDIVKDKLIDIKNGIQDINKKIIRTTNSPNITLQDDGLRILRAVRFASTLNFKIEKSTLRALKIFTPNLNQISKERILKEVSQLVKTDLKFNKHNTIFLDFCNKLNLNKYVFNSSLSTCCKFNKSDINSFYKLSADARLIGFYILVLKSYFKYYTNSEQLGYSINMILGINGIKESGDNIKLTEKIYRILQNLNYNIDSLNASINYLTLSDTEREIINNLINKKAKQILSDNITKIKANNIPLNIHQLNITAQDLISIGIEKKYITKILSTLYNQVLNMSVPNIKDDLVNIAKEINETFTRIVNTES